MADTEERDATADEKEPSEFKAILTRGGKVGKEYFSGVSSEQWATMGAVSLADEIARAASPKQDLAGV